MSALERRYLMKSKQSKHSGKTEELGQKIINEIDNESILNENLYGSAAYVENENNYEEANSEFDDQFEALNNKAPVERFAPKLVKASIAVIAVSIALVLIPLMEFDLKVKTIEGELGAGHWAHIESFADDEVLNKRLINVGERVTQGNPVAYLSNSQAKEKVEQARLEWEREELKLVDLQQSFTKGSLEVNRAEKNLQDAYLILAKTQMYGGILPPPEVVDFYQAIKLPNSRSKNGLFNKTRVEEKLTTIRISLEERLRIFPPQEGMPITISYNQTYQTFWGMLDTASEELLGALKGKERNIKNSLQRFFEFEDRVFEGLVVLSVSTEPALESGAWMKNIVGQYISLRDKHRNKIFELVELDEEKRRLEKVVQKYPTLTRHLNLLRKEYENFFVYAALPANRTQPGTWNGRVAAKQIQEKTMEFIHIALPLLDAFSSLLGADIVAPKQEIENLRSTARKFQQRVDHLLFLRPYTLRSGVMDDKYNGYLSETQQNLEERLLGTINTFLKTEEKLRRVLQKHKSNELNMGQQLAGTQKKLRNFLRNKPLEQMAEVQSVILEKEDLDKRLKQVKLTLNSAEKNFRNQTIRAPMSGTVTKLDMGIGDQIRRHNPLGRVENLKENLFRGQLSQNQLELVTPGQPVEIKLENDEDKIIRGNVKWVAAKNNSVNDEYRNMHWNVLISLDDSASTSSLGSSDGLGEIIVGRSPLYQIVLEKIQRFAISILDSSQLEEVQKVIVDDPTQIRAQEIVEVALQKG